MSTATSAKTRQAQETVHPPVGQEFCQPAFAALPTSEIPPIEKLAGRLEDRSLTPKQFGALGEEYAAAWLQTQGWTVLSRNWHTRYGELDIVMLTPELTVVFVEVKSRRTAHYGAPQEAVTHSKQLNLRRAACEWLLDRRNRVSHHHVRFDVVTIALGMEHPTIRHIVNAF
ncbi:YraN family protein [Bifidobacterium olomucense]|uniref:YraN family protein n=1 Tax=Bifidobacterium olomucense TaxID=2675324 RepID=UPI00145E56A0|nr:YraN family protein [Bifidobacterium sp. DSM 109959]